MSPPGFGTRAFFLRMSRASAGPSVTRPGGDPVSQNPVVTFLGFRGRRVPRPPPGQVSDCPCAAPRACVPPRRCLPASATRRPPAPACPRVVSPGDVLRALRLPPRIIPHTGFTRFGVSFASSNSGALRPFRRGGALASTGTQYAAHHVAHQARAFPKPAPRAAGRSRFAASFAWQGSRVCLLR